MGPYFWGDMWSEPDLRGSPLLWLPYNLLLPIPQAEPRALPQGVHGGSSGACCETGTALSNGMNLAKEISKMPCGSHF